jgi:6-phosphogluconolactonase (cycloisomerase 2 family)
MAVSGVPQAPAAVYSFTLEAKDSQIAPAVTSRDYSILVVPDLSINPVSPPAGRIEMPYTLTLSAAGGVPPYTWTLAGGSLPSGMTLSPSGVISGTPTGPRGTYTFSVQVSDSHPLTPDPVLTLSLRIAEQGSRFAFMTTQYTLTTLAVDARSDLPRHVRFRYGWSARMALHPSAAWAYVAQGGTGLVDILSVDPLSGSLTQIGSQSLPNSNLDIVVHPSGDFLYVAQPGSNLISHFAIDPGTGLLTAGPTISTSGSNPKSLAIHPSGSFLYSANNYDGNISLFSIGPFGDLTPIATIASASAPEFFAIHPDGNHAYALCGSGLVVRYSVNPSTGNLTFLGTTATGSPPLHHMSFSVSGAKAYISSGNGGLVYTLNPATGDLTFASGVPGPLIWMTPDPAGDYVYALSPLELHVFLTDATTGELSDRQTVATRFATSLTLLPGNPVKFVPRFAFVSNEASNSVSGFTVNSLDGSLTPAAGTPAGTGPRGGACDGQGRFLYIPNRSASTVSAYTIDATTGALTSVGSVATGTSPTSLVVDPSDHFCYVANEGSNDVSAFSINQATGALTSIGSAIADSGPRGIAVDPLGRFLYVTNAAGNSLTRYSIEPFSGSLTFMGLILVGAGAAPGGVHVDPSGKHVYLADAGTARYGLFEIAADGTLATGQDTFTGSGPIDIHCDPTGRYLYVAHAAGSEIRAYQRNDTQVQGTMIGLPSPAPGPSGSALDAGGRFLYVTLSSTNIVRRYILDPLSGALTVSDDFTTGQSPSGVVVTWTLQ